MKEAGILRNHRIMKNDRIIDTVCHIIQSGACLMDVCNLRLFKVEPVEKIFDNSEKDANQKNSNDRLNPDISCISYISLPSDLVGNASDTKVEDQKASEPTNDQENLTHREDYDAYVSRQKQVFDEALEDQESLYWQLFSKLEDVEKQTDSLSEISILQEKLQRVLASNGISAQVISEQSKKLEVFVEGKGWCFRRR
ncbi:MAG TPA: hypothetical protein VEL11_13605 [Candidatus Bathyarchaeia archaeon]|nr:hypothetical protein [Candidatus Bathyarchaeia archaeon]